MTDGSDGPSTHAGPCSDQDEKRTTERAATAAITNTTTAT